MSKKTKKLRKPRKLEEKKQKKLNRKKNRPVRFRFYKSKIKKTELNPNWKKNRAK
jgi:hypothetical protein